MFNRTNLQAMLEELLESRNVYFNPPESVKLRYPAIVYSLTDIDNTFANDSVYKQDVSYTLTYIDQDSDNDMVEKISKLPKCKFDRSFVSDNLYHYTFTIYY